MRSRTMKIYIISLIALASLTACGSENESSKTVSYWQTHTSERKVLADKCFNNAANAKKNGNCINAALAARVAYQNFKQNIKDQWEEQPDNVRKNKEYQEIQKFKKEKGIRYLSTSKYQKKSKRQSELLLNHHKAEQIFNDSFDKEDDLFLAELHKWRQIQ